MTGNQARLGPRWRSALSRQQGRSHQQNGVPCQDQVLRSEYDDGALIVALADGAGSARYSHYGADIVLRTAASWVGSNYDRIFRATSNTKKVIAEGVTRIQNELVRVAAEGLALAPADRQRLGLPDSAQCPLVVTEPKELASTLLLVALKDDRYMALHLGDGVIGMQARTPGGRVRAEVVSSPDNGEFANQTLFITSSQAHERLRLYRGRIGTARREIIGFILMSDGPETVLYSKASQSLAPACAKLWQATRDLAPEDLQPQLDATVTNVIIPRTTDDCSLALVAR